MKEIHIVIGEHWLYLKIDRSGGSITSNLGDEIDWDRDDEDTIDSKKVWNSYVHALESLILAHACAGIKVNSRKYIEGIRTALDASQNL